MFLADRPLPMNQLSVAMVQDLGKMYENNAAHEKNDLDTVWESMYSKGLHRKVSSQCYFTPQEIEEAQKKDAEEKKLKEEAEKEKAKQELEDKEKPKNEKEETEAQKSPREETEESPFDAPRNFASVHLDRALNSGRAHLHDEGRRYRKRTFSGSLSGEH